VALLKLWVPSWECAYGDLSEIQAIGKIPLVTTGIRFRKKTTDRAVIFWTANRAGVLHSLELRGLTVSCAPVRFYNLDPER
jgi:hypothetical protein